MDDKQHPNSLAYATLSDDVLALPRDSREFDRILRPERNEDGEPIPELLVLNRCTVSAESCAQFSAAPINLNDV